MKKSSVYLNESEIQRLRRLAAREGKTQAEIIRAAIASYDPRGRQDREFSVSASWEGDGSSIGEVPDEELLKGFGN